MNTNMKHLLLLISVGVICFLGGYFWHGMKITSAPEEKRAEPESLADTNLTGNTIPYDTPVIPQDEYLRIYEVDVNTYEERVEYFVRIENDLSLREKLEFLADRLSLLAFSGRTIKIISIDEREGKHIAVIDLREFDDPGSTWPSRSTWRSNFQGSTGGWMTTTKLRNSFLQKDYTGRWIDAVEFYYEGTPISEMDFDHIFLHGLIYR